MIKILYIHGYHGQPNGGSFQKLSKYAAEADFGGEQVEMHAIDYDADDPYKSVRDIKLYYSRNDIDLIIGSPRFCVPNRMRMRGILRATNR